VIIKDQGSQISAQQRTDPETPNLGESKLISCPERTRILGARSVSASWKKVSNTTKQQRHVTSRLSRGEVKPPEQPRLCRGRGVAHGAKAVDRTTHHSIRPEAGPTRSSPQLRVTKMIQDAGTASWALVGQGRRDALAHRDGDAIDVLTCHRSPGSSRKGSRPMQCLFGRC
jgi:hypothetical protein